MEATTPPPPPPPPPPSREDHHTTSISYMDMTYLIFRVTVGVVKSKRFYDVWMLSEGSHMEGSGANLDHVCVCVCVSETWSHDNALQTADRG